MELANMQNPALTAKAIVTGFADPFFPPLYRKRHRKRAYSLHHCDYVSCSDNFLNRNLRSFDENKVANQGMAFGSYFLIANHTCFSIGSSGSTFDSIKVCTDKNFISLPTIINCE